MLLVPTALTGLGLYWYFVYRIAKRTADQQGITGTVQYYLADNTIPTIKDLGQQKSQNGWPASPDKTKINIVPISVQTTKGPVDVWVRGELAPKFMAIADYWARNIEPIETIYGYNYREIRGYEGTGTISNHGSGTAIDINATRHPLGAVGTIPADRVVGLRNEAARLGLRWGGDYRNRKDEMHFEFRHKPTFA
jgi:hypothetical protein